MNKHRWRWYLFGVSCSVWFLLTTQCIGQSLFEKRDERMMHPVANFVARDRGDLLVVLITESTDVENRDARTLDRQGSSNTSAGLDYGLGGNLGNQGGTGSIGQSTQGARAFSGDSQFRSERQLQDRFSVVVADVLPNGNMLIEGRRKIWVHGDERTLHLTGIVRNLDVLPNNTVSSQLVANLNIRLVAKGTEDDISKQRSWGRKLNRWLPF